MNIKLSEIEQLSATRNLRTKEVVVVVGLSRPTIYRLMDKFQFPQKMKISQGLVGWRVEDLKAYIELGADGWYEKYGKYQQAEKLAKQA